ncbi:uncharacterized protein LOC124846846 [Vigna umbellata]|uniref:uncharacterized protein LOC124846846 n=1 Tax=Vigna umbellata TaxID=87088 RepID=UPI001F5ED3D7|nr:uncharacterized protein LOC124846846 [Vigna umbellata]
MVVWLFVALIITQTYTANLASMLTAERLEPTVDNIDRLRNSYIRVGYSSGSFVRHYVETVLKFHPENMRNYGELEEYAEAFRRKEIGVAFLEVPAAKIFLAKYCKEFIQAGPLYKVGGVGFAFPRGSPLIPHVNKALLDLVETGKVSELENKMLGSEECEDTKVNGETASLSPNSFWVLFILTGGTSTFSLLVYVFCMNYANSEEKTIWGLTTMIIQQCNHAKRRMSGKVSDVAESPTTSSTTHNFDAVIDVSIISYRYQYADFTQPYTDPGVVMVVPLKSNVDHRVWLFMKPFTNTMWFLILAMVIYNGFILWMLERRHSPEITGSMLNQTGTMAWLNFDAVIDVSIISYRYQYADFTQPYTDPGVVMVVPLKSKVDHRAWLFMKPFTKTMWVLILAMVIYNGFILWMLERRHSPEITGSMLNQTGTMAWLGLTPLMKLDGDKLHSNLSKIVMVVWLFVALIITQTYTANLASMLTAERLEPTVDNIDRLRNSYIRVGYSSGSFVRHYVETVLKFHPENMRNYGELEEFAEAFRRKEIGVAFLEAPAAKFFVAKYCKEFIQAGPLYKVGGVGFAFPRGSPLIPHVNKALLDLVETGKVSELENKMLGSEECEDTKVNGETASLSPNSFWVLFILTGGTSTFSLLVYVFCMNYANSEEKTIWGLTTMIIQQCNHAKRRMSGKVSDVAESPTTSSTTHVTPTQV